MMKNVKKNVNISKNYSNKLLFFITDKYSEFKTIQYRWGQAFVEGTYFNFHHFIYK